MTAAPQTFQELSARPCLPSPTGRSKGARLHVHHSSLGACQPWVQENRLQVRGETAWRSSATGGIWGGFPLVLGCSGPRKNAWDFPGGPMVKNPPVNARVPHAMEQLSP